MSAANRTGVRHHPPTTQRCDTASPYRTLPRTRDPMHCGFGVRCDTAAAYRTLLRIKPA